jgi:beta-lactam-binding protein with PASTA domain
MSYTKKFLQIAALMMGMLALVLISAIITMKVVTWGRTEAVPDLSGKEVTSAISELKKSGLEIKIERQEHHPTVPEGHIISQQPRAGSSVKRGRDVQVVVSLGSQEVVVPEITGQVFRKVQVDLKQAGLVLGDIARANIPQPREQVVVQYPSARTVLQKGATVDLLVSDGPVPGKYVTPDLMGMTVPQAGQAAKELNVNLVPSGVGKQVVSQDPKPGYPVFAGAQINLTLGTKAAPATSPALAPKTNTTPAPVKPAKERA